MQDTSTHAAELAQLEARFYGAVEDDCDKALRRYAVLIANGANDPKDARQIVVDEIRAKIATLEAKLDETTDSRVRDATALTYLQCSVNRHAGMMGGHSLKKGKKIDFTHMAASAYYEDVVAMFKRRLNWGVPFG